MCDTEHLFIIWGKYKNVLGEAAFLVSIYFIFIYRNETKVLRLSKKCLLVFISFLFVCFLGGGEAVLHDNDIFNSELSLRSKINNCCDLYDILTLVTFMPLTGNLSRVC